MFFRRGDWIATILTFALAGAATFSVAVTFGSKQPLDVRVVRAVIPAVPLQVRVDPDANGVRLSWDPAAAQVASPGVLQVRDGEKSTTQVLDPAQVASGWLIYRPVSRTVVFQLSVRGNQGLQEATIQVPDEMLPSPATLQLSKARREQEALAYDETPHPQRRTVTASEGAAYDPKQNAAPGAGSPAGNQDETSGQPRTLNGPANTPGPAAAPSQTGPAKTSPPGNG